MTYAMGQRDLKMRSCRRTARCTRSIIWRRSTVAETASRGWGGTGTGPPGRDHRDVTSDHPRRTVDITASHSQRPACSGRRSKQLAPVLGCDHLGIASSADMSLVLSTEMVATCSEYNRQHARNNAYED